VTADRHDAEDKALPWLTIRRGKAPLIISLPHTGTNIPTRYEHGLVSLWLARKDTDWWIDRLYTFAVALDATIVHTAISRTVIDVNRDPSGVSLYPGQATTELCPTTTFDGESLYEVGAEPDEAAVAARRRRFYDPYHASLRAEVQRLRSGAPHVVVYDCHSIRSVIPRLFDGVLPHFNVGTNSGAACDAALSNAVCAACEPSGCSMVVNGRFKGGAITRSLGRPEEGVHALQMELACRGYMHEPLGPVTELDWPSPYDAATAEPMRAVLQTVLRACLAFAQHHPSRSKDQP
jgi:N-formylglutamate deformylase